AHCPIKAHDTILETIRNYLNTFPDVDGIMLDYIRYINQYVCYCDHCKAAFQDWLNETITDWTQFYPGGSRYNEYLEWRTLPVTQLVKDIHDLVKSINPNILISEAAWSCFDDTPVYWRKFKGQDTAKWIAEGYIDFVAPMMYAKSVSDVEEMINANLKYWMGGSPEGPIPLVAFLRNDWDDADLSPDQLKAQIDLVRSKGLDGWIIWRYGGPGVDGDFPDITNYLSIIDMPEVFAIKNIHVETSTNSAIITWITDIPSTSKVEYSPYLLFNASWEVWSDFHYWNITKTETEFVENATSVVDHRITLSNLTSSTTYYFRVQSKGSSGIATSKVLSFTTKS
ncbi:MAG: fibronectin type III domain-containing protein, partial [Candidatus Baldrarchaeia archaeon]